MFLMDLGATCSHPQTFGRRFQATHRMMRLQQLESIGCLSISCDLKLIGINQHCWLILVPWFHVFKDAGCGTPEPTTHQLEGRLTEVWLRSHGPWMMIVGPPWKVLASLSSRYSDRPTIQPQTQLLFCFFGPQVPCLFFQVVFKALRRETCARICKESIAEHNEMQWTRLYTYIQMLQKHNGIKRVFSAYYVSHYVCRGSEQRLCQAAKLPRWKTQVLAKGQMVDEDEDWVSSFISSFIVIQIDLIYHHDIFISHHLSSWYLYRSSIYDLWPFSIIYHHLTSFNFIYHHVTLTYHHLSSSYHICIYQHDISVYHLSSCVAWPIVHHLSSII